MLHAGTIDFCTLIDQLAKSGQPLLVFRMCSTKRLTPVISSFSINKLGAVQSETSRLFVLRIACQPDFRVFACPALVRTITLAADGITTSQSGLLSNKCRNCRRNVILFSFSNSRALLPTFLTNCPDGSHFS